jgi:hypothetical protein
MPDCVNLRERFGADYRITFDDCYDSFHVPRACLDPWMMQIRCRGGVTIYPHGGDLLAVEVDYHRYLAKRLAAIPGVTLHQDGGNEKTFPLALFEQVAALVRPRRKRKLSLEQRAAATARLAQARARLGNTRQSEPGSPETSQRARMGPK